jgi:Mg/Co/Ni transporter MgtE
MAGVHGSRVYYQVLLQPNRAELVNELAKEAGVKATEMIRRMVYAYLERELPASVYKQALAADEAVWRQSVRNRVEGRAKSREASKTEVAE